MNMFTGSLTARQISTRIYHRLSNSCYSRILCEKLYKPHLCLRRNIHSTVTLKDLVKFETSSFFDSRLRRYLMKLNFDFQRNIPKVDHQHNGKDKSQDKQFLGELANRLLQAESDLKEVYQLQQIAQDDKVRDKELQALVQDECERLKYLFEQIEEEVISAILPESENPTDGIIMEFSAGVGGQEAMLFCADLLKMYCNHCDAKGFEYTLTQFEKSDLEGVRHASINIDHPDAYGELRFESGVHRVQRIPKTEKAGRIHTSTVTVAIFPRPSEIVVSIDPKDLKIETKRASGAGGQHVNTTESAVRIVHLPTGLSAECQTQRSQIQNRQVAMNTLRARLYQMKIDEQLKSTRSSRKLQVGSSARSDKIRTYNFPQDRVTDHRINFTSHNLSEFLRGGKPFGNLLETLRIESRRERLTELLERGGLQ